MKTSSNNNIIIFTIGTFLALIILYVIKEFLGKSTPSGPVIPNIPFSPIEPSKIVQPTSGLIYYISTTVGYLGVSSDSNEVLLVDEKVAWKYLENTEKTGEIISTFILADGTNRFMYLLNTQSGVYIKTIAEKLITSLEDVFVLRISLTGSAAFYGYLISPTEYVKNGAASFFIRYKKTGSEFLPIDDAVNKDRFRFTEVKNT